MTGQSTGRPQGTQDLPLGKLDPDTVDRIDVHLERALHADDADDKDFHVRHARQLLEVCKHD